VRKSFKRRITETYFNIIRNQQSTIGIINNIVFRMANNQTETDEFMFLADDAFALAVAEFDPNSGAFATILYHKVLNTLRHARDTINRTNRVQLIDSLILDSIPDKENLGIMIRDCLSCLDIRSRRIIVKFFFEKKNIREIAAEENTNYAAIFLTKRNALSLMKTVCLAKG